MIRGERVAAILAAGGAGLRAGVAKQWLALGGETVLRRSARLLAACPAVDELVAVVPPGEEGRGLAEVSGLGRPARAVAGGEARADSVRNGLAAAEGAAVVLVHDAARPFATPDLALRVAEAAARDGAALAALPVTDTVKRAGAEGPPRVAETLDRRTLWLAQTPQGFRRELLLRAYAAAGAEASAATDECALVERLGAPVTLVAGEPGNFKITGPEDVARARAAARGAGRHRRRLRHPPLRRGAAARARRRRVRGRRPARPLRRRRVRARHRRRGPRRGGARRPRPSLPGHRPPLEGGLLARPAPRDRAPRRGARLARRQLRRDPRRPAAEDRAARRGDAGAASPRRSASRRRR